jgi:hypothetical protein
MNAWNQRPPAALLSVIPNRDQLRMEQSEQIVESTGGGETVKRGLGSDLVSHFATGAASGVGLATPLQSQGARPPGTGAARG